MNENDRAAYAAEIEHAKAQLNEHRQNMEMVGSPEYRNFASHLDKAGITEPERRIQAFKDFKASGRSDAAAFAKSAQNNHVNARMNAFLRSK